MQIQELNELFLAQAHQQCANAILMGHSGAGKTHTIGVTAPRPVYFYSFDPGGCKGLRPLVEKGEVIVDPRFEANAKNVKDTKTYVRFGNDIQEKFDAGFFDNIGTLCLDSLTTLSTLAMRSIAGTAKPDFDHWRMFGSTMEGLGHLLTSMPCHNILTAHVDSVKDEVTGSIERTLLMSGQSQKRLPIIMGEVWAMEARDMPQNKVERSIYTQSYRGYITRSREMVGSEVPVKMPADIRKIITALGYNAEDKTLVDPPA